MSPITLSNSLFYHKLVLSENDVIVKSSSKNFENSFLKNAMIEIWSCSFKGHTMKNFCKKPKTGEFWIIEVVKFVTAWGLNR